MPKMPAPRARTPAVNPSKIKPPRNISPTKLQPSPFNAFKPMAAPITAPPIAAAPSRTLVVVTTIFMVMAGVSPNISKSLPMPRMAAPRAIIAAAMRVKVIAPFIMGRTKGLRAFMEAISGADFQTAKAIAPAAVNAPNTPTAAPEANEPPPPPLPPARPPPPPAPPPPAPPPAFMYHVPCS